jgi:hypothetical protein
MNLSHLLTALLAGAIVSLVSGAEASHHFAAPVFSPLPVQAGLKCELVDGKLVCGKSKAEQQDGDGGGDDDDDDTPKKSKDKKIPKNCKKARCEPGLVVLDKPNKYGACCEAREGLPPPKQQEAEKCKFPGEVGTPPNCTCPPGTEFMGYKGCLPKKADPVGPSPKKVINECYTFPFVKGEQAHQAPFTDKCRDVYKGQIKCDGTFESGKVKCCCTYSQ